jgi:hypothetical protein
MTRKTRSFALVAGSLYLFVLWSAFRWSQNQRLSDGSIFDHIENERLKKFARDKPLPEPAPPSTAESRLNGGGPAFVAVRYDATHVVFMVANDSDPRFAEPRSGHVSAPLRKIPPPEKPGAGLAGLQELWEPESLTRLPAMVSYLSKDEDKQWILELSSDTTIPVSLEQPVVAPSGCTLAAGFLATVAPPQQSAFATTGNDYFIIRRHAAASTDPPQSSRPVSELRDWKPAADFQEQIATLLAGRMTQEVARIDAQLLANAANPNQPEPAWPAAHVRPRLKDWIRLDQRLTQGQGHLDYDVHAFHLTPDAMPRLFVRARWKLDDATVFLMTAWLKEESAAQGSRSAKANPVLLYADSTWSKALREGNAAGSLGDNLGFQTVLAEFDADHDGWAELLVHNVVDNRDGPAVSITLYLYTDLGLVPLKASYQRDAASPESCLQK